VLTILDKLKYDYNINDDILNEVLKKKDVLLLKLGNLLYINKNKFEKELINSKYIIGKQFNFRKKEIIMKELIFKNEYIEIWGENKNVLETINYNFSPLELEFFYRDLIKMINQDNSDIKGCKYIIIDKNNKKDDNDYFEEEGIWYMTLKGFITFVKMYNTIRNFQLKLNGGEYF